MQRLLGLRPQGLCPGRNSQETTYSRVHCALRSGGGWLCRPCSQEALLRPSHQVPQRHCCSSPVPLPNLSTHVPHPATRSGPSVDAAWRGAGGGLHPGLVWSAACTRRPASEAQPLGPPEPGRKRRARLVPACSGETRTGAGAPPRVRAACSRALRHGAGPEGCTCLGTPSGTASPQHVHVREAPLLASVLGTLTLPNTQAVT